MSKQASFTILVPAWIDLQALSEEYVALSQKTGRSAVTHVRDYLATILQHVHHKNQKLRDGQKPGWRQGAPIRSKMLKRLAGRKYTQYVDFLVEMGVLRLMAAERIHQAARRYIIHPPEGKPTLVEYEVTTKHCIKNLKKISTEVAARKTELLSRIPHTIRSINSGRLVFRYGVFDKLEELKCEDLAVVANLGSGAEREYEHAATVDKYEQAEATIQKIMDGRLPHIRDIKGERLHSPLTNLKKVFREYLLIDGEPVCELDFRNSQPFLLSLMMNSEFWMRSPSGFNISRFEKGVDLKLDQPVIGSDLVKDLAQHLREADRNVHREVNKVLGLQQDESMERTVAKAAGSKLHTIIMLHVLISMTPPRHGLNFMSLSRSGTLYDELSNLKGVQHLFGLTRSDEVRNAVKGQLMKDLYGAPQYAAWNKKSLLRRYFPMEDLFLRLLKDVSYQAAPILLQRIEAGIVLEGIAESFLAQYPSSVIYTIHDSFLVRMQDVRRMREMINLYMEREVGVAPPVGEKYPAAVEGIYPLDPAKLYDDFMDYTSYLPVASNIGKPFRKLRKPAA